MGWACGVYGWGEGVYRVLVGKPEGRRPLGRPRRRWVDIIRMDLQEVECGYMDWSGLAQDRDRWRTLVSAVMNLRVPWNAGNFLTSCKPVSFSRRTLYHGVSINAEAVSKFFTPNIELTPVNGVENPETVNVDSAHLQNLIYIDRLSFWPRNYFFLILAHPVYKIWIILEPNTLELWNKQHFEEKKMESIYHV